MTKPTTQNALDAALSLLVRDWNQAAALEVPNRIHRSDLSIAEGTGIAAGDRLLTGRFEGPRETDVVFAEDLYRIIEAADPDVLGKMETIISRFPDEWPEGTHQGETGLNRNKRMVRIKIDPPATYEDREGVTHQFDEMHVTGILFTREILANRTRHYGYSSSESDAIIAIVEADLAKARKKEYLPDVATELRRTPGGHQKYVADLERVLESLRTEGRLPDDLLAQANVTSSQQTDFDADGRPVFSKNIFPLLGGHGDETARKKFEYARYLLPGRGKSGPLAFGYGRFVGEDFRLDGTGLGVFVSLKRVGELPRIGEAMEKESADAMQSWFTSASEKMARGTSLERQMIRVEVELHRSDPLEIFRRIPIDVCRRGAEGYGRAIRDILGENLSDREQCLIPYKYPHRGNVAIDTANPRADGSFRTVWYDLGGWKFGNTMTEFQRFGYVFYSFGYGLSDVVAATTTEGSGFHALARLGRVDIVQEYLRGFFHDKLDHPQFRKWAGKPPAFYKAVSNVYHPPITDRVLEPIHLRTDAPFVSLLREMMGGVVAPRSLQFITDCVRRWVGSDAISVPPRFKKGTAIVGIVDALSKATGPYEAGFVCSAFQSQRVNFIVKGSGQRIADELNAAASSGTPSS